MKGDGSGLVPAILDTLPDPAVMIDRSGAIVVANNVALRTWPGLAVGRHVSMALRAPEAVKAVEAVLGGAPSATAELSERVPVERMHRLTVTSLRGTQPGESSPAAMLVFRDLTEERRLEMMRVDFVASASHELRTPLASLLGFIETLQGRARDDAQARERFLEIMQKQARRMARLIDDLLSLSRIEMSEHRHPETPVDLVDVVRQMVDAMRPPAQERGVTLEFAAPTEPLVIAGERDDLLRVVENLVENAVRYGGDGGKVAVTVEPADTASGRMAVLAVRDEGPGIASEHLPRLTERFYRVNPTASRDKGGTGLGLAIVKHIVNRHRGRLTIESSPGKGAVFRVSIPLLPKA